MSNNNQQDTALEKKSNEGNSLTKRENDVGFSLRPKNLNEALKVCEYLANSNLVPKQYRGNKEDILVCINWGLEVGLKPLQALNQIAVINGNPSMYGSAPLALVRNSPDFEFILEDNEAFAYARDNVKGWEHLSEKNPDDTSICVVKRKGEPPVVREFSKEDVAKAKLGNVHNTYPKDMRKYRARSRALEAAFGDVLRGIRQAELEEETNKMIEEGHYDDLNVRGEVKQPENRETVDIDAEDTADGPEKSQSKGQSSGPQQEPETDDRESLKAEVNDLGKQALGKEWYKESKAMAANLNEDAEGIHQLGIAELQELKNRIEYKLEKQNAKAGA